MTDSKVTLITGASRGIGRAAAEILAARGHAIIGLARKAPDDDFTGEFVTCDLLDRAATDRILADLTARYAITGLVNNAGIVRKAALEDVTLDDLFDVLQVNMGAALQATQAVVPGMKSTGWGRIVNTSSLTALGVPHRTSYAASKAGLINFTRSWALELAPFGITVNAVAPGPTSTEMFHTNNPPGSAGEKRYLDLVPMNRIGAPDEVAAAIVFLLSDEASFITGQTVYVDGGASIGKAPI